jgi:hypothetical protein
MLQRNPRDSVFENFRRAFTGSFLLPLVKPLNKEKHNNRFKARDQTAESQQ